MDKKVGRIPPHNQEAEKNVLGILLLSNDKLNIAVEMLSPEDFYNPIHTMIYSAMVKLYNLNKPVDLITVSEELRQRGELENTGGISYLGQLSTEVVYTSNIEYYIEIIKDKSTLRNLIDISSSTLDFAYEDREDVDTVLEYAEENLYKITEDAHAEGLIPVNQVLVETFNEMDKRSQDPNALTGVTTGFTDLDDRLSGLQKSDLVLIAARPSMGKTALMVNIAMNAAINDKAKVAIFSLEMSRNQLAHRMISSISHVDLQKIISAKLSAEEWDRTLQAIDVINSLDIHIDDTAGISPTELKAKARRLKSKDGLDLIVIDYLQLMQLSSRNDNRQQEISEISRNLKGIAKDLNIPVVALSQLSRAPEMRGDKRPILSDLRESGAIEQDADVVMFLYRDEYYNPETEKKNIGEVIIAKHRNGPTGMIELTFLGNYTKFVNKERE